jgi:hypothetical protein
MPSLRLRWEIHYPDRWFSDFPLSVFDQMLGYYHKLGQSFLHPT